MTAPRSFEPMPDAIVVNGKFSGDLRYAARRGDKVQHPAPSTVCCAPLP